MTERLWGAVILAAILWMMFAVPYCFVFVLPQPLQVAAGFAAVISAVVYIFDWFVDRRNSS